MTRRIRLQCDGGRSRDLPSRRCGAGSGDSPRPHHEKRNTGLRGGERKAARGGKVQRLGCSPWLDKDSAKRTAASSLLACPEHGRTIARPHEDDALWRKPELVEAGRIDLASFDG